MKKILMTLAVAMFAVVANAQVYVGGGAAIVNSKADTHGAESVTSYKLIPEIGYKFADDWAVGVKFGWQGSNKGGEKAFTVEPYARWTFAELGSVNLFVDGGVGYTHYYSGAAGPENIMEVGFKPGVSVNLTEKLSFVAHVGFLGWQQDDYDAYKVNHYGLDLDGNNLTFGLYYNF